MDRPSRAIVMLLACLASASCSSDTTEPEPPVLTSITLTGTTSVALGTVPSVQFTAAGADQAGRPYSIAFAWSSSDASRAIVDATGLVSLISAGPVVISASAAGVVGTRNLQILPIPPAPVATAVQLDDATNDGDAGDLSVTFARASDETRLSEYRLVIVKSAAAAGFNLTLANALAPGRYVPIPTGSGAVGVVLPASLLDSDGDAIATGTEYIAIALSVADGVKATTNALSAPSDAVVLANTTIKITFIADDGMAITDGTKTVLIDALPQTFSVLVNSQTIIWYPAAPGLLAGIRDAAPPYDDVSALLLTHDHPDHWDIGITGTFLTNHPGATVVAPSAIAANFAGHPRVQSLSPALFQSQVTVVDGITIEALRMVHFSNFGVDFSGVQNLAFIVEIGGKRVLHLADSDFTTQNYAPFNLATRDIDVVILPAAAFKLTTESIERVRTLIAPGAIVASHLETNTTAAGVRAIWGSDVKVFSASLQFLRF